MTVTTEAFPRAFAIRFKELERWDPISFERITWHWPKELMIPIGAVLKARKEKVDRSRFAFSDLQPITIHFDGSLDRRNVDGDREYTMELFFARPGDIVVAKIDLKNGAVGIVPPDWRNVVVTGHFAVYEPDRSRLLPETLHRIIQTRFFKSLLWRNKIGAEGRKEVKLDFFESLQIPLPPLPIQHAIVERWEKAQKAISEAWYRIDRLENEPPLLVYTELGALPPTLHGPTAKYLVQCWKDLERWSFNYQARTRQRLLGNASILPEYVREVIQTPLGRSYFQSSARTAVGMGKIGAEDIRNFPIPLPPLDEQRKIVQQVEGIWVEIAREQGRARRLAAAVKQEVEEVILGTLPIL